MWQQQGRLYFGCSLCTAALRRRAVLSACSSCWGWMKGRSRWKVRFSCARRSRWLLCSRREKPLLTTCARCENSERSTGPTLSRPRAALATRWLHVFEKRGLNGSSTLQSWQNWIPRSRLQLRRQRNQLMQSQRPRECLNRGLTQRLSVHLAVRLLPHPLVATPPRTCVKTVRRARDTSGKWRQRFWAWR